MGILINVYQHVTLNAKWASKSSEISASFKKGSFKIIEKSEIMHRTRDTLVYESKTEDKKTSTSIIYML